MIKGIGYQKVDISEPEYVYYTELAKEHGADCFRDLFETDINGMITVINPTKSIPWVVLFFIQNIMINQHLRSNEKRIRRLEKKLGVK